MSPGPPSRSRRLLWLWVLLAAAVAAAAAWWAVHRPAAETAGGPVPSVLRLPLQSAVPTMDPGLAEDSTSIELAEQLFLGLTDFDDATGELVPELATDWSVSPDGRTVTFHLREARWSDGRPVTAGDLVWAARRNIAPATAAPYAFMMYGLRNAQAINTGKLADVTKLGVSAPDDRTVRFELEQPAAYFPAVAGMWMLRPLPRWAIEAHGAAWTEPANIVVNGPYTLAEWKRGDRLVLRRNPAYFAAGDVHIGEVRYLVVPEGSTGLAMYENGELDLLGSHYLSVPSTDIQRIKADPVLGPQLSITPALCTYYFGFNTARPPMDDARVRRAFSAAIDRKLLIDQVVRGEQRPATTFVPTPVFGAVPPAEAWGPGVADPVGIGYDPDAARRWLAEAGYPGGRGFPEVVLMYNTSEGHARIAQAVQQMWRRELGVTVRLENQEWKVYLQTTREPSGPHIFRMAWCADYPDANNWLMEVFHPTRSANRVHWHDAEFARVTEAAQAARDPAERKRLYRRAEQILCREQAVIAPVYFYTQVTLASPRLRYTLAPLGGNHLKDWSFAD